MAKFVLHLIKTKKHEVLSVDRNRVRLGTGVAGIRSGSIFHGLEGWFESC